MESELFVKKIRKYSIISLLLPLIVINSCFILYKFLGDTETYFDVAEGKCIREEVPTGAQE